MPVRSRRVAACILFERDCTPDVSLLAIDVSTRQTEASSLRTLCVCVCVPSRLLNDGETSLRLGCSIIFSVTEVYLRAVSAGLVVQPFASYSFT